MSKTLRFSKREQLIILITIFASISIFLTLQIESFDLYLLIGLLLTFGLIFTFILFLRSDYRSEQNTEVNSARESEKRKFFYDHPLPMWIYEVESLNFLDVNDAAILKYGYRKEEFLNMTLMDIRPEDEQGPLLEYMERELKSYESGDVWTHKTKDGTEIIVSLSAHAIDYEGVKARLVMINDITETVSARDDADHYSSFLSNVLESLNDIVWVVDRDLKLVDANHKFRQSIHELSGEKIENGNNVLLDDYPPKTKQFWRKKYLSALNGEYVQFDYKMPGVEGDRTFNIFMTPGRNKNGIIPFVICSGSDVTSYVNIKEQHREALKQYELITKSTNDAVWDLDLFDNSLKWGQGIQNRFGYELAETNLEWWEKRVHPDDYERVNESLSQTIKSTDNYWREGYRFKTSSGTYKQVIDQGYIMRDKDGTAYRMIGAIQDIDYLIKSRDEIKKLSVLASKTSNSVIITDKDEHIEWVNEGFTKMCGYTMDEVLGKNPGELLQGPDTDQKTKDYIREKLDAEEEVNVEILNYSKSGEKFWVEMTITPVDYTGDGKVDNYIAIETDITARKKRQELLELKNRELHAIAFITAHQLRKPVANLLGLSRLMQRNINSLDDLKEMAPLIVKSCEELDEKLVEIVTNAYRAEKENEAQEN